MALAAVQSRLMEKRNVRDSIPRNAETTGSLLSLQRIDAINTGSSDRAILIGIIRSKVERERTVFVPFSLARFSSYLLWKHEATVRRDLRFLVRNHFLRRQHFPGTVPLYALGERAAQ